MKLTKLTDRIFYLEHDPEVDRPMLAYVKGDIFSLAIDAGYSASHVKDFYNAIENEKLPKPEFTVLTHWHYDHTFGLHAINGISIAHEKTNLYLKKEQEKAKDECYIDFLRNEDKFFKREYKEESKLNIVLSDISYTDRMTLNLGTINAQLFHEPSPHSEDTTCIYIPEEKVLFLGDSSCEDFFNNGYMDKTKLYSIIETINSIDCNYCILSHSEPLKKEDLLSYLNTQYRGI